MKQEAERLKKIDDAAKAIEGREREVLDKAERAKISMENADRLREEEVR